MLAHEVIGDGPPLLLIHGTLGTRGTWDPVRERLARERRLILIDLPGMGESEALPDAHVPSRWTAAIGEVLDAVEAPRPAVAGHSMGGWAALELGRAGRASSVLALAPAGLWERTARRSVFSLRMARTMSLAMPASLAPRVMRSATMRRAGFGDISARPADVPAEWAVGAIAGARRSTGFREHIEAVRATRFRGGAQIAAPTTVVFAKDDRMTPAKHSQLTDELPTNAVVEHWDDCGHMVVWDQTDRTIETILRTSGGL